MPLIRNGTFDSDDYTTVADDAALPESGGIVVSAKRWAAERETLSAGNRKLGVRLTSDISPEMLRDDLSRLSLVVLEFPKFRDGRAYSWARMLRQRLGFTGEIRATGDVLRDQIFFMARCGIDAFEVPDGFELAAYEQAMRELSLVYQPATDGRKTIRQLRGRV